MTNDDASILVTLAQTGKTFPWTGEHATLLELARAHDIDISSGCEYGDCATCTTDLLSGEVEYLHATGATPDPGTCLPCSCRPKTSVSLGA